MKRPVCCSRNAIPYKKIWDSNWPPAPKYKPVLCYESGWRCKICGRIRIPTDFQPNSNWEKNLDILREKAIAAENLEYGNL